MREVLDPLMVNSICRLCLKNDVQLLEIFEKSSPLNIPIKIMDCTTLSVRNDDGFPSLICENCLKKLNKAHKFKRNCLRSAEVLKGMTIKRGSDVKVEFNEDNNQDKWSPSDDECIEPYQTKEAFTKQEQYGIVNIQQLEFKNVIKQEKNYELDSLNNDKEDILANGETKNVQKYSNCAVFKEEPSIFMKDETGTHNIYNTRKTKHSTLKTSNSQLKGVIRSQQRKKAKPEKCKVCDRMFTSAEFLLHHIKLRHEVADVEEYFKTHQLQNRPHVCSVCGKGFTQLSNLLNHHATHSTTKPYICDICNSSFKMKNTLRVHMRVHDRERRFQCEQCPKAFKSASYLRLHCQRHSGGRTFICSYCGKGFYKECQLLSHIRGHTGERPYACEYCGKAFSNSSNLRAHRLIHPEVREALNKPLKLYVRKKPKAQPVECKECCRMFRSSEFLLAHMRVRHPGPPLQEFMATHKLQARSHVCSICGKGFCSPWYLSIHQKIHAEERTFQCDVCQKAYKVATSLKHHMKSHSDVRDFKCDRCPKAFRASHHLSAHLKWHLGQKEFKCIHCDKAFIKECHLQIHVRTHTGEKPYSCDICAKTFSSTSGLRSHKKTHTGEQPFACKICSRPFSTKASMERHLTTHRNITIDNGNMTVKSEQVVSDRRRTDSRILLPKEPT